MKQESRTNINRVKKDISSPDSFTPPEELKRQLITTMQSIYDEEDIEAVERAYKVAYKAHEKQKRKSGEPYIIHPLCVAIILAELELDKETIVAGILHDVVEDQIKVTKDIILIEGNWLLLKQEPWRSMQQYADYKILILAEEEMLKERLVSRKEKGGSSREEAEAWYQNSDSKNVTRVLRDSLQGDLLLKVEEDNDYIKM